MAIITVKKKDETIVPLPDPKSFSWGLQDVDADGSGRNQNGDAFRDRVARKRKWTMEWPPLTAEQCSTILKAVTDVFFQATGPDAEDGTNRTMTCYVGDRTTPMYSCIDGEWRWESLAMNFVER